MEYNYSVEEIEQFLRKREAPMSEQDDTQSPTKQRGSRKTNTANKENGKQAPAAQRPANNDTEAWKAYWNTQGQPWRIEPAIDEERQKYLSEQRCIRPDIEQGIYPFKDIKLSRADVEWLLVTHENGRGPVDWSDESQREREGLDLRGADLCEVDLRGLPLARLRGGLTEREWLATIPEQHDKAGVRLTKAYLNNAHLEGAYLSEAHLERAYLSLAHLKEANLWRTHLERANLSETYLQGAILQLAHLEGAYLTETHLEDTDLSRAYLEGAVLNEAHLKRADLRWAHLAGAILREANLEGAYLSDAHLEGKSMPTVDLARIQTWGDFPTILQPADLRGVFFDSATRLKNVTLGEEKLGFVLLADVRWGKANLIEINWEPVEILGDEYKARQLRERDGKEKKRGTRINEYRAAVRANRQLVTALRDVGMNEEAAHFAYRAQRLQRIVFRLEKKFSSYFFSGLLDLIAGFGYRPVRSIIWYLIIIFGFAMAYFAFGHIPPLEAFVLSLTSFHGRGFFPGNNISLSDPRVILAAFEAVVGLLIEISFISTFTQRYFGR